MKNCLTVGEYYVNCARSMKYLQSVSKVSESIFIIATKWLLHVVQKFEKLIKLQK
jgi:hypothetical protein